MFSSQTPVHFRLLSWRVGRRDFETMPTVRRMKERLSGFFVGRLDRDRAFLRNKQTVRQRANVVLPDPFDPIMAVNSPGRICKLIDFRTGILTKWKLALISSIMGERG